MQLSCTNIWCFFLPKRPEFGSIQLVTLFSYSWVHTEHLFFWYNNTNTLRFLQNSFDSIKQFVLENISCFPVHRSSIWELMSSISLKHCPSISAGGSSLLSSQEGRERWWRKLLHSGGMLFKVIETVNRTISDFLHKFIFSRTNQIDPKYNLF